MGADERPRGLREAPGASVRRCRTARSLPEEQWRARHRALVWLLWAHVVALPIVALLSTSARSAHALARRRDVSRVFGGARPSCALGGRRAQSLVVAFGLLTCSALLVHITGGLIEAHFHFFVMVAALSLYEDWVPFLIAVALRAVPARRSWPRSSTTTRSSTTGLVVEVGAVHSASSPR